MRDEDHLSARLLSWYDQHARVMPWRVAPEDRQRGVRPDPYKVWLSEVMLQQTTVAAVRAYFRRFVERWPTVTDLAMAADADVMAEWAGLGYYARARNLLACARAVVAQHGGVFPADLAALRALPGVGPYTAGAIASIAFDLPEVVVDGNVERVMARVFAIETPLPLAKPLLVQAAAALTPKLRAGDYAQAVMDLGATICTPRQPACGPQAAKPVRRASPPNCRANCPRRSSPPAKAKSGWAAAPMGRFCWNGGLIRACWAALWAFRERGGTGLMPMRPHKARGKWWAWCATRSPISIWT